MTTECNPEDLFRYAEGMMDDTDLARTRHHLDQCPTCRQYEEDLRQTIGLFGRSIAYTASGPCPPGEVLLDLAEDRLRPEARQAAREHLHRCQPCRQALEEVQRQPAEARAQTAPEPLPESIRAAIEARRPASIVSQLKEMVRALAARGSSAMPLQNLESLLQGVWPESLDPSPVLAFPESAGVAAADLPLRPETGWSLSISRGPLSMAIDYHGGQLNVTAEQDGRPLKATGIRLAAAGSDPMVRRTDELGRCTFEPVSPAPLRLEIDRKPMESES